MPETSLRIALNIGGHARQEHPEFHTVTQIWAIGKGSINRQIISCAIMADDDYANAFLHFW